MGLLSGNQKVDVIVGIHFGWVHSLLLPHLPFFLNCITPAFYSFCLGTGFIVDILFLDRPLSILWVSGMGLERSRPVGIAASGLCFVEGMVGTADQGIKKLIGAGSEATDA